MRAHQDGGDVALRQVGEQLVQLDGEKPLAGHRVEIAVEAVDDDHAPRGARSTAVRTSCMSSPGDSSAGSTGRIVTRPESTPSASGMFSSAARVSSVAGALVEDEHRRALPARGRRGDELGRERGLAGAGGADDERARALLEPAAEQLVELGNLARQLLARQHLPVLRRDQAREHVQPAAPDRVVVVAAAERHRRGTSRPAAAADPSPYSGLSCSRRTTAWAMLCTCTSWSDAVMSSSSITVQPRAAKYCLSARIWRR